MPTRNRARRCAGPKDRTIRTLAQWRAKMPGKPIVGSRSMVCNGQAFRTAKGNKSLTYNRLKRNSVGKIVSIKASNVGKDMVARKKNNLAIAGYLQSRRGSERKQASNTGNKRRRSAPSTPTSSSAMRPPQPKRQRTGSVAVGRGAAGARGTSGTGSSTRSRNQKRKAPAASTPRRITRSMTGAKRRKR